MSMTQLDAMDTYTRRQGAAVSAATRLAAVIDDDEIRDGLAALAIVSLRVAQRIERLSGLSAVEKIQ